MTISIREGLSKKKHRRAARLGPRSAASNKSISDLLLTAGFENVESVNVTRDFANTAKAWQREYTAYEAELRPLLGDEFDERTKDRRGLIDGIEEGLLERYLASGTKSQ